jgi:hypothetical protein
MQLVLGRVDATGISCGLGCGCCVAVTASVAATVAVLVVAAVAAVLVLAAAPAAAFCCFLLLFAAFCCCCCCCRRRLLVLVTTGARHPCAHKLGAFGGRQQPERAAGVARACLLPRDAPVDEEDAAAEAQ